MVVVWLVVGGLLLGFCLFVSLGLFCLSVFKVEWASDNNLGIEFLLEQVIDEMLGLP